jgi:hypothetical protein
MALAPFVIPFLTVLLSEETPCEIEEDVSEAVHEWL